jgi:glycosyltransferase involved in cell wall biosynthesis
VSPAEIIIEIDSPKPVTVDRLQELPVTVNSSPTRRGKGAAVTAGFDSLTTDVLAFVDADGSTPAHSVNRIITPVIDNQTDLAVGSRRHPDATVHSHQTYVRRWLGNLFAFIARKTLAIPINDFQCGAKAITQSAWLDVREHLHEPGFAWDLELIGMTAALGYSIQEIPIEWTDQPDSTVNTLGTTVSLAKALVMVRHRTKLANNNAIHGALATHRSEDESLIEQQK